MSNLVPGNQKHLTLEDRLYIEKAPDVCRLSGSRFRPLGGNGHCIVFKWAGYPSNTTFPTPPTD